jgi:Rieske Fe-S protein
MFRQFITFFLIMLLTVSAVVASQTLPNSVESAIAKPAITTSNPEIAKATIENLLSSKSKSNAQPTVRRTTVEGKYAIVTWQWGEAGGQSILTQQGKRWKVVGSGGGAVNLEILKQKGVPDKIAEQLMQKEQAAQKH